MINRWRWRSRNVAGAACRIGRPVHERFVNAVYRGCLRREADQAGFEHYVTQLSAGSLSWEDLLRGVLQSDEFANLAVHNQAVESGLLNLHECRKTLFANHLPKAERVVDLGGAATDAEEGALFALGYPYAPRELIIVELPPDGHEPRQAAPPRAVHAKRGTFVRYEYGSMSDLSCLQERSVDLVVSGQSIEHVEEAEAKRVFEEAFRVLRPGGRFCLDTPNARLTRLQSPDTLIHPGHKKEYSVRELQERLQAAGFEIRRALGVCPMPASAHSGYFDYREMRTSKGISEDAEVGYAFYLEATKP